jgi:hypothetical protein
MIGYAIAFAHIISIFSGPSPINNSMADHRVSAVKRKFSYVEDALLRDVISRGICSDWCEVARELPGRTARQCRERWTNYLNPIIDHSAWTKAEDELLIRKYEELGAKWQTIVKSFPHRSKNQIKNRWFAYKRRIKAQFRNAVVRDGGTSKGFEMSDLDQLFPGDDVVDWVSGQESSSPPE